MLNNPGVRGDHVCCIYTKFSQIWQNDKIKIPHYLSKYMNADLFHRTYSLKCVVTVKHVLVVSKSA